MQIRVTTWVWRTVLLAGLVFQLVWFVQLYPYYKLPIAEKAIAIEHDTLRSSGQVGLALGIVATGLFLANLCYLVRRRFLHGRFIGTLRSWMDLHVTSGILGAGCVALHAGFSVRSAAGAVASATLCVVILAGIVGRYLYSKVPRSQEGRELHYEQVRTRVVEQTKRLHELGFRPSLSQGIERPEHESKLVGFLRILFGDQNSRSQYRDTVRELGQHNFSAAQVREIKPVLRQLLKERLSLHRFFEISQLMSSWRFLHRWLALVMIGTVICHIAIAFRYGQIDVSRLWP